MFTHFGLKVTRVRWGDEYIKKYKMYEHLCDLTSRHVIFPVSILAIKVYREQNTTALTLNLGTISR
jgi:hypothetical protein